MKTRIISMILVVVMLALALVGCGYDFTDEDMSENAEFNGVDNVEAFDALLHALTVVDPSFGNLLDSVAKENRANKVSDAIYELLLKEVEKTTSTSDIPKETLKEGEMDYNDWLYYAYYATYEKPAAEEGGTPTTVIIYPSSMSAATAISLKLGYRDETLTGADAAIRKAILAAMTDNKLNFNDWIYKTTTEQSDIYDYVNKDEKDGTNDKKVWVYVDYTVTENSNVNKYTNVKMLLDLNDVDNLSFLAKSLLESETKTDDKGTTEDTSDDVTTTVGKYKINTKIDKLVEVITVDGVDVVVPAKPTEPTAPTKPEDENDQAAMDAYNAALEVYNTEKAAYDTALKAYDDAVKKNAENDITYTDITVKHAVESNIDKYISVEYTTETELKNVETELEKIASIEKGTKINYYVYPVKYATVPNLDAEIIIKELIASIAKDSLDCLKEAETEVTSFKEALTAYNTAKSDLESKKSTYETKQSTYKTTLDNAINDLKKVEGADTLAIDEFAKKITTDDIKNSDDPLAAIGAAMDAAIAAETDEAKKTAMTSFKNSIVGNSLVVDAAGALQTAKADVATADKKLNGDASSTDEKVKDGAEKTYEKARDVLFAKVGDDGNAETTDDAVKGQEKIVADYEKKTYDSLAETYENELKINIGKAIWKLMKEKVKVTATPEEAVDEIYERMYEDYEYDFYTGYYGDKAENGSNYKHYYGDGGGFDQYLIEETIGAGKGNIDDAKKHVRTKAEEYVNEIVILYFVADALGQKLTEDEVDEYKKDTEYTTYVESYGEINMLASRQAEKLFDYLLAVETETKDGAETPKLDEETGARTYKNIKVTTFTEKDEEADKDENK